MLQDQNPRRLLQLADNCEFESQSSQSHDAITPLVATLAELAADRTRVAERAGQRSADQRGAGGEGEPDLLEGRVEGGREALKHLHREQSRC